MPTTRTQLIKRNFDAPDFGEQGAYHVLRFLLHSTENFSGLETVEGMENAIRYVHQRYVNRDVRCYSVEMIRAKVIVLRRRYRMFNRFITVPDVYFDDHTNEIVAFGEEYNEYKPRENLIEKYFRLYGFPYYELHQIVFDVRRAALFPEEIVGSLANPLEVISSDTEVSGDGDSGGDGGLGGGAGSDDDGTVTQA